MDLDLDRPCAHHRFDGRYVGLATGVGGHSAGIAMALMEEIAGQNVWAKNVVLLFTEAGRTGLNSWLQDYYGTWQRRPAGIVYPCIIRHRKQNPNMHACT